MELDTVAVRETEPSCPLAVSDFWKRMPRVIVNALGPHVVRRLD